MTHWIQGPRNSRTGTAMGLWKVTEDEWQGEGSSEEATCRWHKPTMRGRGRAGAGSQRGIANQGFRNTEEPETPQAGPGAGPARRQPR